MEYQSSYNSIAQEIPGFSEYLISEDGRVWSLEYQGKPREIPLRLKHDIDKREGGGYRRVTLFKSGKRYRQTVHSLVLLTFVGPRPNGFVVRHLDGNPANNTLANLAYGTSADNKQDSIRHGTAVKGSRQHCAKLNEVSARYVKALTAEPRPYSDKLIASWFNVSPSAVWKVRTGRSWAHLW